MHTFPEKHNGFARVQYIIMYLDLGFETLHLKFSELKLREVTVANVATAGNGWARALTHRRNLCFSWFGSVVVFRTAGSLTGYIYIYIYRVYIYIYIYIYIVIAIYTIMYIYIYISTQR